MKEPEYHIRDTVYLRTDNEQLERIVTAIIIRESGIVYELSQADKGSIHYAFEMSNEIDESKRIGIR